MIVVTAQQVFEAYLKEIDKAIKDTVKTHEQSLIMAEALLVKVKEIFYGHGKTEEEALLFIEHALQELNDTKPTIH
jgi:hypothetical protein|tara:strand:- start:327 stop:554 length:228 start_codon:yes stop_codon:yes gene_type:complete